MRLRILSDLHREFDQFEPAPVNADLIVLAGDIDLGRDGGRWARQHFKDAPVGYVLGNHEFYRHALPELTHTLKRESEGSGVHVLENAAIELNGWTILGCTLWSDFCLDDNREGAMRTAEQMMSDYALIDHSEKGRGLRAIDTAELHAASAAWLRRELSRHDSARTVVVTHHAPSARSIPPFYKGSPLNPAFASNLDALVAESRVPLWIHGHTHFNVDYLIGQTRVLSNQRGYPDQLAAGFNPSLVVQL
jgi:predicted phosphodiesterase